MLGRAITPLTSLAYEYPCVVVILARSCQHECSPMCRNPQANLRRKTLKGDEKRLCLNPCRKQMLWRRQTILLSDPSCRDTSPGSSIAARTIQPAFRPFFESLTQSETKSAGPPVGLPA